MGIGQWALGDKETREQGDKENNSILLSPHPPLSPSPPLPLSLSTPAEIICNAAV
ncbi:hypothetical protein PI95_022325 [Hassallia byssoidea VB512170]|uniref:Uncharacterized protein n=1 Tax=Hassallia byssoidea VB512170 TaxID=1304833 RepID=A0A846HF33_9CYAN|nr:hypothetical protein [Hassalia byssoidea]NEU75220.1 hypothetical protein [Hassalia byssoidea VB512170]